MKIHTDKVQRIQLVNYCMHKLLAKLFATLVCWILKISGRNNTSKMTGQPLPEGCPVISQFHTKNWESNSTSRGEKLTPQHLSL